MGAVYPDARNPFAFPELLTSRPRAMGGRRDLADQPPERQRHVDITDQFDRKMRALRCHVSQHQHPDEMEQSVRMWNAANAQLGGLADGRLAERFLVADAR